MTDLAPRGSAYHSFAVIHDRLGWRSFLEGRISTVLVHEMHQHLATTPARINASDWAKGLVNFLLRITHRQWIYRNNVVHYRVEGRPIKRHEEIIAEMQMLMQVDSRTLLPRLRHLYEEEDFEALGAGSTTNRLYWRPLRLNVNGGGGAAVTLSRYITIKLLQIHRHWTHQFFNHHQFQESLALDIKNVG